MIRLLFCFLLLNVIVMPTAIYSQTSSYNQFWNDFQFVTPIKGKWSNEINIGQVWTSVPIGDDLFHTNAQLYARVWLHYSFATFKVSLFTGYNHNPEIRSVEQDGLPEIRSAIQGIYYFKKTPVTLSARLRIEDHLDKRRQRGFEENFRVRSQLKLIKPLNTLEIAKGTIYLAASEEVFTQTGTDILEHPRFGSNRITIGCGYAITNDFLIEMDYSNDYYPSKIQHLSYNAIQVNLSCYNWLKNIKRTLTK
ncbi:DUF2490 domain-containing protein [Sphingobacterium sp. BIGb0165]|uniref:DUF2490 domain-containing protein n=1 Tax=Sphingobacterium sp. BIGb0165 TaxID=2940615 RepID=UPI002167F7D4|nr:DUF2490 domain-containing protein [Sphingobacterium sp. BIGb0165]MCS4224615.1 hypothetical protein [Sphingobacterium sp. BIGb0165]